MISLLVVAVIQVAAGLYCETPECPGFSLLKSISVKGISNEFIDVWWEPKEDYWVDKYEVHWFADSGCLQCNGKLSLTSTSIKLSVKACTFYTIEVYGYNDNMTTTAPIIIRQVTAPNPLINGTAVQIDRRWAVIRWLKVCDCANSFHLAACFGPNFPVLQKPSCPDNVVLFNFSILNENSTYVCNAYTLNLAGSSSPSVPVLFKTGEGVLNEESINLHSEFVLVSLIILTSLITVGIIYFLNNKGIIKISWRRSYVVNQTASKEQKGVSSL